MSKKVVLFCPSFASSESTAPSGILALATPLLTADGHHGLAQVNGWRGDTSIEKRVEYDLYYVRHWTLAFDLFIVLLTFLRGFTDKNAY